MDLDAFRLRTLLDRLIAAGEVAVRDAPTPLAAVSGLLEASDQAVFFRNAGPERFELVGGIAGSHRRLGVAFDCAPDRLALAYLDRMSRPQKTIDIAHADAPVQAIQITGDAIDATKLPFHLQHERDGAPYISSAIDFAIDPVSGKRNVGCRRLMLCGRRELRANLTQQSDLKAMYLAAAARGEHLPVNFAIGTHPADLLASSVRLPLDEFDLIATLRGAPLAMVPALTNAIPVPADAELIIEGYFDRAGYTEREGPYGELLGYYGPIHDNPAYRITAITMRRDVLHQTILHGAVRLARTESVQIGAMLLEAQLWQELRAAGIPVIAVNGCAATGGMVSARASVRANGRRAVEIMLAHRFLKHAIVTDESIDIFSDEEVDWAMSTRLNPERDIITVPGQMAFPMDLAASDRTITKIGYDLTARMAVGGIRAAIVRAPRLVAAKRFDDAHAALAEGPKSFAALMAAVGSEDGRELVVELERLKAARTADGEWCLSNLRSGQEEVLF
jgi:UbiD family decarboxylase